MAARCRTMAQRPAERCACERALPGPLRFSLRHKKPMIYNSAAPRGVLNRYRPGDMGFSAIQIEAIMSAIYTRGDRLMKDFVLFHCLVALGLAFFYSTWLVTLTVAGAATAMFFVSLYLLPRSLMTRCIAGVSLQTF